MFLKSYLKLHNLVSLCIFRNNITTLNSTIMSRSKYKVAYLKKEPFSLEVKVNNHSIKRTYSANSEEKTHFGYENVTPEEKAKKVLGVFENVAESYDIMNDLMSGGVHRLWKDHFVLQLNPTVGTNLLDVAGGTGDITFRILSYIKNQLILKNEHPKSEQKDKDYYVDIPCKITVCDISENMLEVGKKRANNLGITNVDWTCGDAQALPFADNTFDAYTIAFGMRNVVDIEKALSEAYRVLKVGGRFSCLEFSQVSSSVIKSIYDAYSFELIPVMGEVVAGDWHSYQYLVESIRKFPDQETYKGMIEDAGFRMVRYQNLTFGVTAIHSGFKI